MYTNLDNFGGYFRNVLNQEFKNAKNVTIASGYTSLDVIHEYYENFISIAKSGGVSKLLLGMAFYEGLTEKKLKALNKLNTELQKFDHKSGVYVTNGRRYHGKVYHFQAQTYSQIYVGSSNFSYSGIKGNIECIIPVIEKDQKITLEKFLDDLFSPSYSIKIDQAEITIPSKKTVISNKVDREWKALQKFDPKTIDTSKLPKFVFPLARVAEEEKSNLNVYFGKGRLNRKTGIIKPRPWYEIELIANKDLTSQPYYPRGDFLAYTDDGLIIPLRTQGDYYKNIRSRKSLQILGIWLKGKLEHSGALRKYEPVTLDTLEEYGNDKLTFYKIEEGKFYLEF